MPTEDLTDTTVEFVSTAAAAKYIGIERSTLFRWVKKGRITPAMRVSPDNGAYLFHRTDVEALAREWANAPRNRRLAAAWANRAAS